MSYKEWFNTKRANSIMLNKNAERFFHITPNGVNIIENCIYPTKPTGTPFTIIWVELQFELTSGMISDIENNKDFTIIDGINAISRKSLQFNDLEKAYNFTMSDYNTLKTLCNG